MLLWYSISRPGLLRIANRRRAFYTRLWTTHLTRRFFNLSFQESGSSSLPLPLKNKF